MDTITHDEVIVTTSRPAPQAADPEVAKPKRKVQPPYAVIVYNDDLHTFDYVIIALCKICGHNRMRAFELALQIHETGRAVVWSGALEIAELKRDQIRAFGPDDFATKPVTFPLGVDIEPMP